MSKLSDLRKLVEAARIADAPAIPPPAPRVTRQPAQSPAAERGRLPKQPPADIDLAQAFADVRRLPPGRRVKHAAPRPAPIPRQSIADDADALLESKYGTEPTTESWDIGQEHEAGQTYVRRGLGTDILRKLRRGHWSVQGELDLHGHTTPEAHDALADFLVEARQRGYRCVRVVHGKGLTSPNGVPVLKGKVRGWLARWDDVLAYSEAPGHSGGGGAVMILLRGR